MDADGDAISSEDMADYFARLRAAPAQAAEAAADEMMMHVHLLLDVVLLFPNLN